MCHDAKADQCQRRHSPAGAVYDWPRSLDFRTTDRDSDVEGLMERCVTVSPLSYDLTNHAAMVRWRERLGMESRL